MPNKKINLIEDNIQTFKKYLSIAFCIVLKTYKLYRPEDDILKTFQTIPVVMDKLTKSVENKDIN